MQRLAFLISTIYCFYVGASTADDSIQVATFHSPPYSMQNGGKHIGLANEIVKSMLQQMALTPPIITYPLKRALYIAQRNKNVLFYPVTRNEQTEEQFHWIGKISPQDVWLFKHKSRQDLQVRSLQEAKQYAVAATRGSSSVEKLKDCEFPQISEVTLGIQSLLMLAKQRVDLVASDELMLFHHIDSYNRTAKESLNYQDYVKVLRLPQDDNQLYIAMSKTTPLHLVDQFAAAFEHSQKSGHLIEVAHWWTNKAEKPYLNSLQKALQEQGYKWIDYTFEGGAGKNLTHVLQTRLQNKSTPQAIQTYVGPAVQALADKETLLALDEVAITDNWHSLLPPLVHDKLMYKGHYIAMPINLQRVNWMWLNPKVFAAVDAPLPVSWDSFFNALEKIKKTGITPVSIGSYAWQEGTLFESLVLSIGGEDFYHQALIALDSAAFKSDTMANILSTLRRIRDYSDYTAKDKSWVDATESLIKEEAAVYFMGDWAKSVFQLHAVPYGEAGYLCLPVPQTNHLFLANSDAFAFPQTGEEYYQGQKTMARLLMSKDVQREINQAKGSIPIRQDISPEGFDQCSQNSMQAASDGTLIPSFNFHQVHPLKIHTPIITAISRFFRTDIQIQETMNELSSIIQNYHKETP